MVTPDPREVAAVAEALYLDYEASINHDNILPWQLYIDRYPGEEERYTAQARAAIAADHQWLAEHAPDAVERAIDRLISLQRVVDSAKTAKGLGEAVQARDEARAAVSALLALYQRPVIDEEAFIDAYLAATEQNIKREMGRLRRMEIPVFLTNEQQRQRRRDAIRAPFRAALEAFVAGGEG